LEVPQGIARLIFKGWKEELSDQEKKELRQWVASSPENQRIYKKFTEEPGGKEVLDFAKNASDEEWEKFESDNAKQGKVHSLEKKYLFCIKAACFIMAVGLVGNLVSSNGSLPDDSVVFPKYIQTKTAGSPNKIVIQLADGARVYLDSTINDVVPVQGNYRLVLQGNVLRYLPATHHSPVNGKYACNYISVPEGRQLAVVLPDSSKVWLNAVSSIRIPLSDVDRNRHIELTGEGYFEVRSIFAEKDKIPFYVQVKTTTGLNQEVKVTGTSFNINAYCDEPVIKTTLLEGKVAVRHGRNIAWLKPGEELRVGRISMIKRKQTALAEVIGWKDNYFVFIDAPLVNILNEISRWYGKSVKGIRKDASTPVYLKINRSKRFEEVEEIIHYVVK